MQYMMLLYSEEAGWEKMSADQQKQAIGAYGAFTEALKKAGALVSSNRLTPTSAATRIQSASGKAQVLDGPYADSKEQLGGYYLIDVADMDSAITWASRCPGAEHGIVELRPVWTNAV